MNSVIKKKTKTSQPCLWYSLDDGILQQVFLVIDRKIFLEVSRPSFFRALLVLIACNFSFNISYERKQELLFLFFEEFILGLRPGKKTLKYRKMCTQLLSCD